MPILTRNIIILFSLLCFMLAGIIIPAFASGAALYVSGDERAPGLIQQDNGSDSICPPLKRDAEKRSAALKQRQRVKRSTFSPPSTALSEKDYLLKGPLCSRKGHSPPSDSLLSQTALQHLRVVVLLI